MMRVAGRLGAVLVMLALDLFAAWVILSAAGSFVRLDWIAVSASPFGRALWLLLFLYMSKDSVSDGLALAGRWHRRQPAS